jgi:hypothetical protein
MYLIVHCHSLPLFSLTDCTKTAFKVNNVICKLVFIAGKKFEILGAIFMDVT